MKKILVYVVYLFSLSFFSTSALAMDSGKTERKYIRFELVQFWNDTVWESDGIHFSNRQIVDKNGEIDLLYSKRNLNKWGFNVKLSLSTVDKIVLYYMYLDEEGLPYYRRGANIDYLRTIIKRTTGTFKVGDRIPTKVNAVDSISLVAKENEVLTFLKFFSAHYGWGESYAMRIFDIFRNRDMTKEITSIMELETLFDSQNNSFWNELGIEKLFVYRLREFFFHHTYPTFRYLKITLEFENSCPEVDYWTPQSLYLGVKNQSAVLYGKNLDFPLKIFIGDQPAEIIEKSSYGDFLVINVPVINAIEPELIWQTEFFGKFSHLQKLFMQ